MFQWLFQRIGTSSNQEQYVSILISYLDQIKAQKNQSQYTIQIQSIISHVQVCCIFILLM
jgi:hypothetical protein